MKCFFKGPRANKRQNAQHSVYWSMDTGCCTHLHLSSHEDSDRHASLAKKKKKQPQLWVNEHDGPTQLTVWTSFARHKPTSKHSSAMRNPAKLAMKQSNRGLPLTASGLFKPQFQFRSRTNPNPERQYKTAALRWPTRWAEQPGQNPNRPRATIQYILLLLLQ